jgi:hypothetical protein
MKHGKPVTEKECMDGGGKVQTVGGYTSYKECKGGKYDGDSVSG